MTYAALFMKSAAAKRMNVIASAVRRSEKARFLFITYGLIGQRFSKREKPHVEKKRTTARIRT